MNGTNIKIYKNDKLIHDCTLCSNPEGRLGWWDAVDGTFHDQTENLQKQAYKESMGTQWIDTGVSPTNADHIRSMTDEELAKWLDEDLACCCYCSEDERLENEPLLRGEKCDEQCKKHLLNWLKQPYKEAT